MRPKWMDNKWVKDDSFYCPNCKRKQSMYRDESMKPKDASHYCTNCEFGYLIVECNARGSPNE